MSFREVVSRRAVLLALNECDRLGRDAFLETYGFQHSRGYVLRYDDKAYDSKAILGVAHQFLFPEAGPLKAEEFSGGKDGAGGHLAKLGFQVDGIAVRPHDWSVEEVMFTVADYFAMLDKDLKGEKYNKAEHNRKLRESLNNRTNTSVEFKHQNISAVMQDLGLPWAAGYKPRGNTQLLLRACVFDFINEHPDLFDFSSNIDKAPTVDLFVEPPAIQATSSVVNARRATKVDFAARDERNRKLGRDGERWAVALLKSRLVEEGRSDLAERVRWASDVLGDGLGYDIESFSPAGDPLYVEVKTTNGLINAPFFVTANEISVSKKLGEAYLLLRIFDFSKGPRAYVLRGALDKCCHLEPTSWKALPHICDE